MPNVNVTYAEMQAAARQLRKVTGPGIIGNVALEEGDVMSCADQILAQAAPEGGMAVPPGRGDGEAENNDLHAATF